MIPTDQKANLLHTLRLLQHAVEQASLALCLSDEEEAKATIPQLFIARANGMQTRTVDHAKNAANLAKMTETHLANVLGLAEVLKKYVTTDEG